MNKNIVSKISEHHKSEESSGHLLLNNSTETIGLKMKTDMVFVHTVVAGLEAVLWRKYNANRESLSNVYANILDTTTKGTPVVASRMAGLQLGYVGPLVLKAPATARDESWHIAQIFGLDVYMTSSGMKDICAETCCPAWLVKQASKGNPANMDVLMQADKVWVDASGMVYEKEPVLSDDTNVVVVTYKIPYLVPKSDKTADTDVLLVRTADARASSTHGSSRNSERFSQSLITCCKRLCQLVRFCVGLVQHTHR